MSQSSQTFLEESARYLDADYMPKIEHCLDQLNDADVWWRANEASNSIGNLLLHLRGNVTQWIVSGVGGRPFDRQRQQEFDERRLLPRAEVLAGLRVAVTDAAAVIRSQTDESLTARKAIQGYEVTVFGAIYHVVEHFSMHTGQIILLTKLRVSRDLKLWEPPV